MTTATFDTTRISRRLGDRGAMPAWRPARPAAMDPKTLVAAYGEHRDAAYRLAYRILGDAQTAEDAVHDAFLKLWTGNAQYDPSRGSMRGLLLTIARHTSIDGVRRRARCQRIENTYCTGETWTSDGPERAMERAEDARVVRGALIELPAGQRSVIEKAYFADRTRVQIAAEMAIPIGTVKSRMRLGMRKLASMLGEGGTPPASDSETSRPAEVGESSPAPDAPDSAPPRPVKVRPELVRVGRSNESPSSGTGEVSRRCR